MTQTTQRIPDHERPGLFSLAQIQYLLKVEFGRALRYGHSLLAMIVAVDRLEELCDRLGYEAKERVVQHAVDLLQRETRPFDFVGRLTGDRLLILVPHVRDDRADTLGRRLVRKAHDVRQDDVEPGLCLCISIGGGMMAAGFTLFCDELLTAAEEALSQAVAEGGDRCLIRSARGSVRTP